MGQGRWWGDTLIASGELERKGVCVRGVLGSRDGGEGGWVLGPGE